MVFVDQRDVRITRDVGRGEAIERQPVVILQREFQVIQRGVGEGAGPLRVEIAIEDHHGARHGRPVEHLVHGKRQPLLNLGHLPLAQIEVDPGVLETEEGDRHADPVAVARKFEIGQGVLCSDPIPGDGHDESKYRLTRRNATGAQEPTTTTSKR